MPVEWMRLLVAGPEKVIALYRRLIASSKNSGEPQMLQRRTFKHEQELHELLADDAPDKLKAP